MSSSTAMETDSTRDGDNMGTESLPQTYRASPEMLPNTSHVDAGMMPDTSQVGAETLPQTGISTAYATTSYTTADNPRTHVLVPQQSYLTDITAGQRLPEQLSYISSNLPSSSLSSAAVMTPSGYVMISHPDDVGKIRVPHDDDVSRLGAAQADDTSRMSVAQLDHVGGVGLIQAGEITRVILPESGDVSIVSVPYSGDVSRISVPHSAVDSKIASSSAGGIHIIDDSKVHISQTDNVVRVNLAHVSDVPVNAIKYADSDIGTSSVVRTADISRISGLSPDDVSRISSLPADLSRIYSTQGGDIRISALPVADVNRISAVEAEDMSRISSLPAADVRIYSTQAGDLRISSLQGDDVNRITSLQNQTSDVRLSSLQAADVGRVSSIQASDLSRITSAPAGAVTISTLPDDAISRISSVQTDVSRISSAHAMDVSRLGSIQAEDARISSLPATEATTSYMHTVVGIGEGQAVDTKPIILPQTGDISITYPTAEGSRVDRSRASDVGAIILPQTGDIGRMAIPQTGDIQTADVRGMSIYQSGNVVRISLPVTSDTSRENGPASTDVNTVLSSMEMLRKPDVSQLNVQEAPDVVMIDMQRKVDMRGMDLTASDVNPAELLQKPDIRKLPAHEVGDVATLQVHQSPDISRTTSAHQAGAASRMSVAQVGSVSSVSLQQAHEVNQAAAQAIDSSNEVIRISLHGDTDAVMRLQDASAASHESATHYADPSIMTLPQTVDVKTASTTPAEVVPPAHTPRQSSSAEVNRASLLEDSHARYLKMKMVAEAAELARNSMQADDINMRLMAETADFVSRNVSQAGTITTSGNVVPQAQNRNSGTTTGNLSVTTTPQKYNTAAGLKEKTEVNESERARNYFPGRSTAEPNVNMPYARKVDSYDTGSINQSQTDVQDRNTAVLESHVSSEKDLDILDPAHTGSLQSEYNKSSFQGEFLQTRQYNLWKEIGKAHSLFRDEDIACFLMR